MWEACDLPCVKLSCMLAWRVTPKEDVLIVTFTLSYDRACSHKLHMAPNYIALMKFVTCGLKKSCWSLEFLRLSIVSQWLLHPVVSHMALPLLQPVLHVTQLLPALWKGDRDAPRGQSTKGRGEDFKRSNFTTRTLSGLYCMCDMEYVMLLCYCSPMPTLVLHIVFAR